MKKVIVGVIIFLLLIIIIFSFNKKEEINNTVSVKPTIKIGVVYPLTGRAGYIGQAHKAGLVFAKKDMEKEGLKYNYEFIFEDNSFDSKKTISIANKLVNIDKVDVIFSMMSDVGNVLNATLGDKKVLQFGWISDPKVADRKLSFPYATLPKFEATLLAEKLVKENIKNVNVFMSNDNYHLSQRNAIEEVFPKYNINYTLFDFNSGEKDFKVLIQKAKKYNAGINVLSAYSPEIEILAKQLKEMKSELPITTMGDFLYAENKEPFEGYWFVMPNRVNDEEFINRIKNEIKTNSTESSESTYEVFKEFIRVCETIDLKEGKLDVDKIAEMFINNKYIDTELLGRFIIMENGFLNYPSTIGVIKNGKVEQLEE